MQNSYLAINASAGSGKTYSLVQRILMICLRYPNNQDNIRHILALTFTNKAANEMKERILTWLYHFSSEDYFNNNDLKALQSSYKEEGLNISIEDLHQRSKSLLDYVLHHYSTLNIGTIDKFNSRLVKSFTYELGLAQNFNLEIKPEPYLIEAVDKMLDEIGNNTQVSDAFMDYINYSMDNNERVSINKSLYKSAKKYINDIHYDPLKKNENFEWDAYESKKNELRDIIKNNKSESLKLCKNILQLINEKDLSVEDFAGGKSNGLGKFFVELKKYLTNERGDFPLPGEEQKALTTFNKGASAKAKNKESEILAILDYLIDQRQHLIKLYIDSKIKEKILTSLLPLKVNADIQKKLEEIEEENDLVLLSKFNILINENLKNEPSPFIYEKVGTQFQHFFFDEFQDTSIMQWENFVPLRDHSISTEHNSFTIVGDPKQSIYRFRGGDSQIMLDIINHQEVTSKYADVINLEYNWRSAKNIVDFNNKLYSHISNQELLPSHQLIFGEKSQQISQSKKDGRVRVNLIENDKKEIFYHETADKMKEDIQHCLDNGFKLADITILCRGNFDIFSYSQLLSHYKVNYNGNEVYIKTISDNGLTLGLSYTIKSLIEFLRWETSEKNLQHLVKMLFHLNTLGRITIENLTEKVLEIKQLKNSVEIKKHLEKAYNLNLIPKDIPQLNLYNYIEYYLQEFSQDNKETDFILNFLEMLFNFTQNAGATIKDFLKYWDEEGINNSIQASDNVDAIQLMTIHKAKGLEFPVVLLPMQNENKDGKFTEWFDLNSNDELKMVNISEFDKMLEPYDENMQIFNETNRYRNRIDRYCVQYVATTRPVEQLYLYLEKPSKTSNNLEIYDYVAKFQPKDNDTEVNSFDIYEIPEEQHKKQNNKVKPKIDSLTIDRITRTQINSGNIKIATPSKNYQNRVEHVRVGIFVHEILSKINSKNDVERVLSNYLLEGLITNDEHHQITKRLTEIIENNNYKKYFDENLKIINERDIIISENGENKIIRPDRLIETKDGYFIIDFKTGEPKEKDQQQVDLYKSLLEKLGKTIIKTELIYI